ncbi:peptidase M61 [Acidobacteriota bacterium]|nr:peptidase M61 [Acidobacteriota bacterium]
MRFFFYLTLGFLLSAADAPMLAPIKVTILPVNLAQHQIEVHLTLPSDLLNEGGTLALPAWTPGSYLIRDYAKFVDQVQILKGEPLVKVDKQQWKVPPHQGALTIRYRVYGNLMSVRENYIDESQAHLIGTNTFMYAPNHLERPYEISFKGFPASWKIACGLLDKEGVVRAANYDLLVDSPIQIGTFRSHQWESQGARFELAITGDHNGDESRLVRDIEKIVNETGKIFGNFPFKKYVFLLGFSPNTRGGLEHLQSTSLLSDPFRFDKEEGYYTLYQLVAHEFFHAWNVKRIKDVVLGPFDYSKENYTKLLWFHEGFTSYMEHQIVNRAGVVPWKYSIKQYENLWNLVAQHPGRLSQSLEESSFDTWIRYYQQNEWTEVSSISYYDHGELTGWLMEAEIVEGSKGQWGLKDLFRELWINHGTQGITDADIQKVYEKLSGKPSAPFWDQYIRRSSAPNSKTLASVFGLKFKFETPTDRLSEDEKKNLQIVERSKVYAGIRFQGESSGGTNIISSVIPGGPADQAGLSVGYEILFVNGWRTLSASEVNKRIADAKLGETVKIVASHRGRQKVLNLVVSENPLKSLKLEFAKSASPEAQKNFSDWSGHSFLP